MKERAKQRTVYLLTAAVVLSMVGGFAMASLGTGQTNNVYQGSQTTTVTALAGLQYMSTTLEQVSSSTTFSACTSTACTVSSGTVISVCAGGLSTSLTCGSSDWVEVVEFQTTTTPFSGSQVTLTAYLTGSPAPAPGSSAATAQTYAGTAQLFTEGSSPTAPSSAVTIDLYFDTGSVSAGPGVISTISVVGTD